VSAGRRVLAVLMAIVLGAALAACGSSGSSRTATSAATATTTTAESATTTKGDQEIAGDVLGRLPGVPAPSHPSHPTSPGGAGGDAFLRAVFDDAQAMWQREFEQIGVQYVPARMTIFRDEVHTACGTQPATVGPFYCPADHGVYLDTRFFDALGQNVGVKLGDFARAYVVGHEVGHHVQTLLEISHRVALADKQDPAGTNARSVRLELQADCFAGVWTHSSYQRDELDAEDFADALRAAAVVGDDFQQRSATGTITPENWTHGSSAQRQHWLTVGFEQGKPGACDTFAT
jgi:predicted metalloprotease/predicted small lipoprotein YifL